MSSAVHPSAGLSQTDLPFIIRSGIKLAVVQTVFIVAIGVVSRFLEGPAEAGLLAVLLIAGAVFTSFFPGLWVNAREIDGIASAAGIGLLATGVFLLIDVTFLQGNLLPFKLYTHRWLAVGGGSNWWCPSHLVDGRLLHAVARRLGSSPTRRPSPARPPGGRRRADAGAHRGHRRRGAVAHFSARPSTSRRSGSPSCRRWRSARS